MKATSILFIGLALAVQAFAQRGDVIVPTNAQVTVPAGAQICADRIFANNPGFGTLSIANASCLCPGMAVVPVELLAFSASTTNGVVLLKWTTAQEVNCHGFEVQRLLPGNSVEWQEIGFVGGAGTTTESQHYSFADLLSDLRQPVATLAYRLRIEDYDGSFTYSPVVEARFDREVQPYDFLPIYPNPASGHLNVSFMLPVPSSVTLTVYSLTGAESIKLMDARLFESGLHSASIPTQGLSPGTYLIELRSGGIRKTRTFVLLR